MTGLDEGPWLQRPVWCEPGHQQGEFGAVRARLGPEKGSGVLTSGPNKFLSVKTLWSLRPADFEVPATRMANKDQFRKNPDEMGSESVLQPLHPAKSPNEGFN